MHSSITKIAYYLPERVLSNDELALLYPAWTADKIFDKTGIRQRHVCADGETALDLAERACRKLVDELSLDAGSVDFLLLCTQSPDYFLPTSACMLQNRLGLPKTCGALDYNLGCSGYVYGLSLAKGLIAGGIARRVLLVTAETYSKHIHAMDKSVRTIFGDGAAASLIDAAEQDGLGQFVLGTDGAGYQTIIVPTGAMRQARSAETGKEETDDSGNIRARDNLFMDGPDVFNFTLDVVPETVSRVLEKNHMSTDDVDLFVFHQANLFMLNTLRKALGLPKEKFVVNMADIGNTVSSTIPIALARAEADGTLRRGMKVMLVGFGVGLSWGATIITW